jgi:hypothetical protein
MDAASGLLIALLFLCTAIPGWRGAFGQVVIDFAGTAMTVDQHSVEIVVRLRRDIAETFRSAAGSPTGAAAEVKAAVDSFGVKLNPLHPGVSDPELGAYFVISGLSLPEAERLTARLRELRAVEAAYMQPPPSPA